VHIFLHFLLPAIVAGLFYRRDWKSAFLIMTATMLVDLDHLLATPVYDPTRCSIGFHPLHRFLPIGLYVSFTFIKKLRLTGIGLLIHMALDSIDCQSANGVWYV
jgi:hypothetical protein